MRKETAALLPKVIETRVHGEATVQQLFEISVKGKKETKKIAGSKVSNGVFQKARKARVVRNGEIIFTGKSPLIPCLYSEAKRLIWISQELSRLSSKSRRTYPRSRKESNVVSLLMTLIPLKLSMSSRVSRRSPKTLNYRMKPLRLCLCSILFATFASKSQLSFSPIPFLPLRSQR